jgi:hypothetical protein
MARKRQAKHCTGHRTDGSPCGAWAMQGGSVCFAHGGKAGQVKAAAQARLVVERAAARFGVELDGTPPGKIALREIARSSAMVCHLADLVSQLSKDELTWGIGSKRTVIETGENPVVTIEQRARQHPFVLMLRDERNQLRSWIMAAHAAGIQERYIRLAEEDGAHMARIIQAVCARLVDIWRPTGEQQAEGRAAIAEVLRAMDRGELE